MMWPARHWANVPLVSGQTWCDRKVLHYFSPLLKACHWLLYWFSTFQAAIGSSSFKEPCKCRHKIALQISLFMFSHLVVIFIRFLRDRPRPSDELSDDRTSEKLSSPCQPNTHSLPDVCLFHILQVWRRSPINEAETGRNTILKASASPPASLSAFIGLQSCAWMLCGADLVYMAWGD